MKCLAHGHHIILLARLEPGTYISQTVHSTTEPLRYHVLVIHSNGRKTASSAIARVIVEKKQACNCKS